MTIAVSHRNLLSMKKTDMIKKIYYAAAAPNLIQTNIATLKPVPLAQKSTILFAGGLMQAIWASKEMKIR